MSWGEGDGHGKIVRPLTALFVAALLLGGCDHEEGPPEVPREDATLGADSAAEAAPGPQDSVSPPVRVALDEIPFEPAGSFPHGEHRRIECSTCHGRPPGHSTHASVECTSCHGVPDEYATLPVRSRAECMSCHHDPDRTGECSRCHPSAPREPLALRTTLQMSVWDAARDREVSFDHGLHDDLACGSCHGEPPENAVTRGCASCHEEHHRPEAECLRCHRDTEGPYHDQDVHLGCGGSGCHSDPTVNALPASRPVCLVCHAGQRDHQLGQICTNCHFVSGPGPSDPHPPGGPP